MVSSGREEQILRACRTCTKGRTARSHAEWAGSSRRRLGRRMASDPRTVIDPGRFPAVIPSCGLRARRREGRFAAAKRESLESTFPTPAFFPNSPSPPNAGCMKWASKGWILARVAMNYVSGSKDFSRPIGRGSSPSIMTSYESGQKSARKRSRSSGYPLRWILSSPRRRYRAISSS